MESVAKRAGVGKGALYRRWADRQTMVASVLADLTAALRPTLVRKADDLESDLTVVAELFDQWLAEPRIIADLVSAGLRDADLEAALSDAMDAVTNPWMAELVERTRRRQEPDPADVVGDLLGAVFWRRAVLRQTPSPAQLHRLARIAALGLQAA
jgi:AcrR family transcriptional regulator